ncbi:hypothetical protein C7T94_02375 [Pedobacter yulinensis]|uniref:Alginate lyase domain-containing protein n=1 Tax=Pedobacter yulinensis TaxID=2126353 RepID=A0A2T3HRE3_9SPHI|nr:alginate lyase family protein [Pedobacter yulinensis]PST84986.1 hypothetical protein C7T94_02375 [Pedobacter yulinensis]
MPAKLILCLCIACIFSGVRAQFVSFSGPELDKLKNRMAADQQAAVLYSKWKRTAEAALASKPQPIEKIRSQGLLMGNPAKTASLNAVADAPKMYALALVYRIEKDEKYLNKATEFLCSWARTNQATGNPVDETKLEEAFLAFDLIRPAVKRKQRDSIARWLNSIAAAELSAASAKEGRSTAKNNWNSHRIKIMVQTTLATGTRQFKAAIDKAIRTQLALNLQADGSTFDFHERDALHYHIYSLEPLLKALIAWRRAGNTDYFRYSTPGGASLKKSVDFLLPFFTGQKQHIEFANSKVGFDKARAGNGEKGYVPAAFVPGRAIPVFTLAAYFDAAYTAVLNHAEPRPAAYLDWELLSSEVKAGRK